MFTFVLGSFFLFPSSIQEHVQGSATSTQHLQTDLDSQRAMLAHEEGIRVNMMQLHAQQVVYKQCERERERRREIVIEGIPLVGLCIHV